MVGYLLGNYLVSTKRLKKKDLERILQKRDDARARLGVIAVEEGLMTPEQTEEVNRLQSTKDRRFGDIAIEQGYLTEDQVDDLLKKQGDPYLSFVQLLMDEGIVKMEEMDGLMEEYRKAEGLSKEQIADIKSGDVDRILPIFLPGEAMDYKRLFGTVVRLIVRIIDRNCYLGRGAMIPEYPKTDQIHQLLEFDGGLVSFLSESKGGLLTLCSTFADEKFEALDADSLDAAGEFLNCANGLYVSHMSRKGVFLEIYTPSFEEPEGNIDPDSVCTLPVVVKGQEMKLTVARLH